MCFIVRFFFFSSFLLTVFNAAQSEVQLFDQIQQVKDCEDVLGKAVG